MISILESSVWALLMIAIIIFSSLNSKNSRRNASQRLLKRKNRQKFRKLQASKTWEQIEKQYYEHVAESTTQKPATTEGLFGSKPAETNSGSGLFGSKPTEAPSSGLFGSKPAESESKSGTGLNKTKHCDDDNFEGPTGSKRAKTGHGDNFVSTGSS